MGVVSGHDLWRIDHTVRLHYMDNLYDATVSSYKTTVTTAYHFNRQKDREIFTSIARRLSTVDDAVWFVVGNRSRGVKHVTKMHPNASIPVKRYAEAPLQYFTEDLKKLHEINPSFDFHLTCGIGDLSPPIFTQVGDGSIYLETATILQHLTRFMKKASKIDPLGINKERGLILTKHLSFFPSISGRLEEFAHTAKNIFAN